MATTIRYYMPCSGTPAHTPSRDSSWNGTWDDGQLYAAVTTKISSTLTEKNCGILGASGTETNVGCRWVSAAVASAHDWTTADSVKMQVFGRYNANVTSAYFHAIIRVMNADCSSEVGVIWEGDLPTALTNGWPGRNTALNAGGGHVHAQNSFSMEVGNHIVIELGAKVTGTAQYAGISFYIGDDQDSDYPENETTTTQTDDTWVEITMEESAATNVVMNIV